MRAAVAESARNRVTTPVRFRNRLYPLHSKTPRRAKVTELPVHSPRNAVRAELAAEITRRLPYLNEPHAGTTVQNANEFHKTYNILRGFVSDLDALIPFLCRANLEFRQESGETHEEAKAEVMKRKLDAMIEKCRFTVRLTENPVDAYLLAMPPEAADAKLRNWLRHNVDRFVRDFFDSLDRLVDQQVCGLVEWTNQNTCVYHFFREVVLQERGSSYTETGTDYRNGDYVYRPVERVHHGTHTHRFARHEYHTAEAVQKQVANRKVAATPAVTELLNRIPAWLEPIVRVIEGTLMRAKIVEEDRETETWESRDLLDTLVDYDPCKDPAVIIDHIVVTGWGPLDLRGTNQHDARSERSNPVWWLAGTGVLAAFSMIGALAGSIVADLLLTILLAIAAACTGAVALKLYADEQKRELAPWQPLATGLGALLGVAALAGTLRFGFNAGGGAAGALMALGVAGCLLLWAPWFRRADS